MRTLQFIVALAFAALLLGSSHALANGHKGIALGMQESDLPKSWKRSLISYEGEHEGDFFRVTVIDKKVVGIIIIYSGETFDRTALIRQISLAQSLKEHSLTKGAEVRLGTARGRDGQAWGVVDIDNRIAYRVSAPLTPDSPVENVSYLNTTAPVIETAKSTLLSPSLMDSLLAATATATPAAPVASVQASTRYAFPSGQEALRSLTEIADRSIGAGKRTVALMNSSETWLSINSRHPEAQSVFADLRQFRRTFEYDFETLIRTYRANEAQLSKDDILLLEEPMKLNETIRRRMTQLRAMGFPEFSPTR